MKSFIIALCTIVFACGKEVVDGRKSEEFGERLNKLENASPAPPNSGPIGPRGEKGDSGPSSTVQGAVGSPGKSAAMATVSVLGIDRSLPWATSNYTQVAQMTRVEVYLAFSVVAMASPSSNPQNHWVDIKLGTDTFCYRRRTSSPWYDLDYKKAPGYILGCDSNSEKNLGAWPNSKDLAAGQWVQVIPRDPKLNGVVWDLTLNTWSIQ